nr:PAS domain S-box protein [Cytophagales bacterium]
MVEKEFTSRLPQFLLGSEIYSLVVTDMKGKIIFVNPLYKQRSSLPPASIIGNFFSLSIHPDDRDAFEKLFYQCGNNPETTFNILLRELNTSGNAEFYWTQWEFSLYKDQNGDPLGVLGVGHDVTQHKAAEETTFLHRLVLDQIRDFVTFTDLNGVITYVNRAEVEASGRPKEEIIGKSISVFGEDPDLAISQQEILKQSLQKGAWRGEVVNVAANGSKVFLDCRTQLIYNERGKPLAICGISTDITEQKERELQLKLSEYKLKAILNSTTDGNIFVSPAYKIQSINQAAQRYVEMVFGKTIKENDSILEFLLPETKDVFLEDTFKA